jgi:TolB-like protein/Flp pilus assembly protein TadD
MQDVRKRNTDRLRCGTYEVDLVSSEIYRKRKRVQLQEQPFRVLALLLARPGEMVTRDALRRALWPGNTFVDFDAGLNTAMRKLRTALDDDAARPRYIETLPRRGYRFIGQVQRSRKSRRSLDSVAVLPFATDADDRNVEYLSEGIIDNLIHTLSEIPGLKRVTARSSVYRYKGTQPDLREVGRALGVRAVVTGSLSLHGDLLSVGVELVDTSDLRHVWGASYKRRLAEASEMPRDLAAAIAGGLELTLSRSARPTSKRHIPDFAAYQLYLQGRYWWNKRPSEGAVERAIEFFTQAIAGDPQFALPYAGLADSYNTLAAWESGKMAPNVALPRAIGAANQALAADPALAEAHTSMAYAEFHFGWNWQRSQEGFQRALSLNPNYASCRHWYSHFLTAAGRTRESLAESIRIIELDPFDLIVNVHLSWHYYMARQHAEALDQANRTLAMEPAFHWGYFFRGLALQQLKRRADAVDSLRKSVELSGASTVMLSALGHAYATDGDLVRARGVLATLQEASRQRYVSSYEIALIYAALGEADRAFEWLDKACEERSGWLPYLNAEPRLDELHIDPRFQELAARVGLPTPPTSTVRS